MGLNRPCHPLLSHGLNRPGCAGLAHGLRQRSRPSMWCRSGQPGLQCCRAGLCLDRAKIPCCGPAHRPRAKWKSIPLGVSQAYSTQTHIFSQLLGTTVIVHQTRPGDDLLLRLLTVCLMTSMACYMKQQIIRAECIGISLEFLLAACTSLTNLQNLSMHTWQNLFNSNVDNLIL